MRSVSIVLPSYNEAKRLPATLDEVSTFCEREFDEWEVIVVDDGSTDATADVVRFHEHVKYLRNERNLGKGRSVRNGMLAARNATVLFSDVDLSTPIEESLALLQEIEDGADVVIANRVVKSDKVVHRTPLRRLVAACFRLFVRVVALRGIDDTQCGFKMFRREVAQDVFARQQLEGWAFDVEILFLAQQLGYTIAQVPVEWRESGESRLTVFSPFVMAADILKIRYLHRGLSARAREALS